MSTGRRLVRTYAAAVADGDWTRDLDRALDELEAAYEAYRTALLRYRDVAGPDGVVGDPRAPVADYERYVKSICALTPLLIKYHKLLLKRALPGRKRSLQSSIQRTHRLRRIMELRSRDPLFAPVCEDEDAEARRRIVEAAEDTRRMLIVSRQVVIATRQLIEALESQGFRRKRS
jgi:hypothetical protein